MTFINFNGKIHSADVPVINANNRGFRFGDGLFETMKFKNGHLILIDEHLARLWNGMRMLKFEIPKLFTPDKLEQETLALIKKNKLTAARVRITVFRSNGGLFDPANLSPNYLIEAIPLPENNGRWNENGLHVCLYKDSKKQADAFSQLKHNNFLPYVMGALYAKEMKCNDALLFNPVNNIADSTIANVFVIKNDTIYTPPLEDGCINGIMRKTIIHTLKMLHYQVVESSINEKMLKESEEVFLTNSIYNLRWVSLIDDHQLTNLYTHKIFLQLTETIPTIFC